MLTMKGNHRLLLQSQRGVGYILGLLMVLTFIGMVALAVDIGRVELFLRSVQGAVDGAALAGADRFRLTQTNSGTLPPTEISSDCIQLPLPGPYASCTASRYKREKHKGFRLAKEMVVRSLAVSPQLSSYGPFAVGPDASSPNWTCRTFGFGTGNNQMTVRIERGLYYRRPSDSGPTFLSFEPLFEITRDTPATERPVSGASGDQLVASNINVCGALGADAGVYPSNFFPVRCNLFDSSWRVNWRVDEAEPPPDSANAWTNWRYSPYTIANAVRVRVTLNSMPTLLAGFNRIGFSAFSNITTRETVASRGIATDRTGLAAPDNGYDPW
ncbi:MAG: hypothetical protein EBZ48_02045 [Proteobacteria bacterium]|nr:hypothetical protein [Pseudomonadota bacterium]